VPEHSRIGFRVRKMGLYFVKGSFKAVNGSVEVGPDGLLIAGSLRIDASTVSTRIPPRDWHLRTRDFLAVKHYPEIRIGVDSAERASEETITVSAVAVVAIRGVEARIPLTAHSHASEGRRYSGRELHVSGTLDRHRFGVRPRRPVEWIVGREVRLDALLHLEPS
jgi:polyisoprenoid-binding protein YceI